MKNLSSIKNQLLKEEQEGEGRRGEGERGRGGEGERGRGERGRGGERERGEEGEECRVSAGGCRVSSVERGERGEERGEGRGERDEDEWGMGDGRYDGRGKVGKHGYSVKNKDHLTVSAIKRTDGATSLLVDCC